LRSCASQHHNESSRGRVLHGASFRIAVVLLATAALAPRALSQGLARPGSGHVAQLPTSGLFVTGNVLLDDGTPPPDSIPIERVCPGTVRREAYTDSNGGFSFQIGEQAGGQQDGSTSSHSESSGPLGVGGLVITSNPGPNSGGGRVGRVDECDLRASLPGYRSDVLSLSKLQVSNDPQVGTIVLHRLANVSGTVISATALAAPPEARKAYEKGRAALHKNKPRVAGKEFQQAVALYPKHAAALYELGRLQEQENHPQPAREFYERAKAADPTYVNPYLALAPLEAHDRNWLAVAGASAETIRLDPVDFPQAYYYNALANFYLGKLSSAEKSAREARKLDTAYHFPKLSMCWR